jgi:phosphoglycerol transferase MdoB-like AlkP superfamily enzyme
MGFLTFAQKSMKSLFRSVPSHLRFILAIHVILVVMFSLFRYIMLVYNRPAYFFDMERSMTLWQAFKIGFSFDVTVATYAMLLPYLALTFAYFTKASTQRLEKYVRVFCGISIVICLVICAADMPYFRYFNARLNMSTIHLKNLGQVAEFLLKEVAYYPVIALFGVGLWAIGKLMMRLWNHAYKYDNVNSLRQKLTATAITALLMVFGLWGGGLPKKPDMKSATFSNDGFINLLTLNPVHTWFDSYFAFDISVLSTKEARKIVQSALGIKEKNTTDSLVSPILRNHKFDGPTRKMNVVVILMESMTADRMGIFGDSLHLTPGLDRLARNSVFFDQCYSAGIHTNCGIYSTLYGMPSLMMHHPMLNGISENTPFSGLPAVLKGQGYRTRFFCSHPKTFDNLDIFLERNGFDKITDQNDYKPEEVANAWGVGDETQMARALTELDSMATSDKENPFFATVLTITTHPPYSLPKNTAFKPKQTDPIKITYEYADWAISSFMDSCATKDWYENTIFVLLGDHGANLSSYVNDVPLSYNHIPLIVHAPGIFNKPEVRSGLASQTDVFPTVMGLLQQDYVQNTMGYDLFREKRPLVFFSQDFRMCTLDEEYLYVARKSGRESLYQYKQPAIVDIADKYRWKTDSMRNFACSHFITAQWMIGKDLVGKK